MSELPFVFCTPHAHYFYQNVGLWDMTQVDHTLADQIGCYWSSLAMYGTPNGSGAHWPAYTASVDINLLVNMNCAIDTEVCHHKKLCCFWESMQVFTLTHVIPSVPCIHICCIQYRGDGLPLVWGSLLDSL